MLPLRWGFRWHVASGLLLVAVLLAGIMPAVWLWPDRGSVLSWLDHIDKWAHFLTFAVLALWFSGQYEKRIYWRIAAGLLVYGVIIEFLQRMVGYRTADLYDVVANLSGITAGLLLGALWFGGWSLSFERWVRGTHEQHD